MEPRRKSRTNPLRKGKRRAHVLLQLVETFTAAAEDHFGAKARLLLEKHVLQRTPDGPVSIADIARMLGVTKQAPHAVLGQIFTMFRHIIYGTKYRRYLALFPADELLKIRKLLLHLAQLKKTTLTLVEWNAAFRSIWGINPSQIESAELLILEIVGFRRIDFAKPTLRSIVTRQERKVKSVLEGVACFIERTLKLHYPRGLELEELWRQANKQFENTSIKYADVEALTRSLMNIETSGNGFRAGEQLADRVDQFEAILKREQKPLNYRELAQHARRYGYRGTVRASVMNLLSADPRFVPMGMSGYWALAAWDHLDTRTITQVILDELSKSRRAMSSAEIYKRVAKKRSVTAHSIQQLLHESPRFNYINGVGWVAEKRAERQAKHT